MRPKKLVLCAWGPYRDIQKIDFEKFYDRGIFLITGPTGAGKTTVFDAITYALYGALSGEERDRERNAMRSDFADARTPTYVELIMEHDGREYRILRNPEYLRPRKRKRSAEGKADPAALETAGNDGAPVRERENAVLYYPDGRVLEGVREVNAALKELLVLDYQQFKKISMIAQGEFARLLVALPKDKTRIFREIFDTGVYERFTGGLGQRSRALYAEVMEKKHKLEEDLRVLSADMDRGVWSEEIRRRFQELTEGEHWDYDALGGLLSQMEEGASEQVSQWKRAYQQAEKAVEKLTGELSGAQELLRRQEELAKTVQEREALQAREGICRETEHKLTLAMNAGFVEETARQVSRLEALEQEAKEAQEQLQTQERELTEEHRLLARLTEKAEDIRALLALAEESAELEGRLVELQKAIAEKTREFREGQESYLSGEEHYRRLRQEYEEASHRRYRSAIGLAASLLEEGKPCPVCGSPDHPAPAAPQEEILSQEALEALKSGAEQAESALRMLHQQIVTVKTQLESLTAQEKEGMERREALRLLLEQEQDPLCREYLTLAPETARRALQEKCQRAGTVAELLTEKQREGFRQREQLEVLAAQLQEARGQLAHTLEEHGFSGEEDYRAARLGREEQERLRKDLEEYRSKCAANRELYQHLKESLKNKKPVNLEELKEQLLSAREKREAAMKQQKAWETGRGEVRRTRRLMEEKLGSIQSVSQEYGYVKELENMASGNNSKRLVFEQYVLAGYFEEILRAANLRFLKMTDGRFEMSRVGEVGDGRVKDYLEIQVMDYYTGKYRSVRTLSGGESFKASLALALGMSDVIQSMNGGIRVDTLFVDEGFGALDDESLDQACSALMSLVELGCLIGIISHVPQLRERIDRQLVIEKTGSGSRIRPN